jgi:hypothetical protein
MLSRFLKGACTNKNLVLQMSGDVHSLVKHAHYVYAAIIADEVENIVRPASQPKISLTIFIRGFTAQRTPRERFSCGVDCQHISARLISIPNVS